jgi:GntR family transcriptional regulator/MocR family aminotransferase
LFELTKEPGRTLQNRLRQTLVRAILDAQFTPNAPLPSSRDLAACLGVARTTVVLVYQQLVDDGYLVSRKRVGHFINTAMLKKNAVAIPNQTGHKTAAPAWMPRFRFRPSQQRNIEKSPHWQRDPYPFIYGQFDRRLFPTADWRECTIKALNTVDIGEWAPDLISRDDDRLVQQIRTRVLPPRGVFASSDEIVITVGAQQALYLLADLLCTSDTVVGMEDPGYPDARNIFNSRTPRVLPLEVDGGGLSAAGSTLHQCDYVYVTPSHQCPTTVTMPLERRQVLLDLAVAHDFVIIEDDYDTEDRFAGSPMPALKSLDCNDRVIYIGSLSKTFAPGLRLGYIVGPADLMQEIRALRRLMVRHPPAIIQRHFALFLALGHYDALLNRVSRAYRERSQVLMRAISEYLPDVRCTPSSGGASCWLEGPAWLDARQLADLAAANGILIETGDVFFMSDSPPLNFFRLAFSSIDATDIEPGISKLGALMGRLKPADRETHTPHLGRRGSDNAYKGGAN